VTADELNNRIIEEGIVSLRAEEWSEIEGEFEEVERHATFVAGDIIIARGNAGLMAVEQPSNHERVARLLASIDEANRFVKNRLDQYERMWNGCGCKINYYK
jgi:hypothetical protein